MAVSHQQQALVRKLLYAGLIVALFTVSLLHRRFVVEPQGNVLQLREVSKGEVKLLESAVRLGADRLARPRGHLPLVHGHGEAEAP